MIDTSLDPQNAEAVKQAAEAATRTHSMLTQWAQKQAHKIIQAMELKRATQTLSLHWHKVKQGWHGGFVSGVHAGFQLGYQTSSKLSQSFLDKSSATLAGSEVETIQAQNVELREFIGIAIGEASMCWSESPNGEYDSIRAMRIVDRLMERFATPLPEAQPAPADQESLPGIQ